MKETQEMLDFCADNNIAADIELTTYDKLNEAYDRVLKNDVKYRFVLDNKSLKQGIAQSGAANRDANGGGARRSAASSVTMRSPLADFPVA